MTPDDSKPVAATANRKGAKTNRNKATAAVTSINRSTTNNENQFFDPDDETCHNTESLASSRPPTDAFTDGDGPGGRPLHVRSTEAPARSKGKGRHKILVPGTPEPDDTEKKPANLSTEERCYQALLDARRVVSPTNGTSRHANNCSSWQIMQERRKMLSAQKHCKC